MFYRFKLISIIKSKFKSGKFNSFIILISRDFRVNFHFLTAFSFFYFILVYADGGICLDILQNRWSPTYDVSAILTSIQVFKIN